MQWVYFERRNMPDDMFTKKHTLLCALQKLAKCSLQTQAPRTCTAEPFCCLFWRQCTELVVALTPRTCVACARRSLAAASAAAPPAAPASLLQSLGQQVEQIKDLFSGDRYNPLAASTQGGLAYETPSALIYQFLEQLPSPFDQRRVLQKGTVFPFCLSHSCLCARKTLEETFPTSFLLKVSLLSAHRPHFQLQHHLWQATATALTAKARHAIYKQPTPSRNPQLRAPIIPAHPLLFGAGHAAAACPAPTALFTPSSPSPASLPRPFWCL